MRIAKGIKGIRSRINENKSGWHIFNEEGHLEYTTLSLLSLLEDERYEGWEITEFTGNGIMIGLAD
jgi:hypothetical protein